MAEVVRLDAARARRRSAAPVDMPVDMPPVQQRPEPATGGLSLLWRAVGAADGHRRIRGRGAACGTSGPLVLAEPGTTPCRACWPPRGEA